VTSNRAHNSEPAFIVLNGFKQAHRRICVRFASTLPSYPRGLSGFVFCIVSVSQSQHIIVAPSSWFSFYWIQKFLTLYFQVFSSSHYFTAGHLWCQCAGSCEAGQEFWILGASTCASWPYWDQTQKSEDGQVPQTVCYVHQRWFDAWHSLQARN
jgi:hypothetical protein